MSDLVCRMVFEQKLRRSANLVQVLTSDIEDALEKSICPPSVCCSLGEPRHAECSSPDRMEITTLVTRMTAKSKGLLKLLLLLVPSYLPDIRG